MPEMVIVTICCGGCRGDFELPARLPLKNWEAALLDAVRNRFAIFPQQGQTPRLMKDQIPIQPQWTLEQCGIYDGSILQLLLG